MSRQITFKDGTGMMEDQIYFNLIAATGGKIDPKTHIDEIRIFLPDWEKILLSESFLEPFHDRYKSGLYQKSIIPFYLEYYRNTHFDKTGKYLENTINNYRKFKINSLEYKKILWKIFQDEKRSNLKTREEDIRIKIEFPIYDFSKYSLEELFKKAAYKKNPTPQQTPMGQAIYSKIFFDKIIEYYNLKIKVSKSKNKYTILELEGLKDYLSEKPIYQELRKTEFSKVLSKIRKMLDNFRYKFEKGVIDVEKDINGNIVGYNKNEIDAVVKETIDFLTGYLADRKDKNRKKEIESWIKHIERRHSEPGQNNWLTLVYINDKFTSKEDLLEQMNIEIEMLFTRCYREWAKKVFQELIDNDKLNLLEKRLFIIMHVGSPFLNYRIPIFNPIMLNYFGFNDLTVYTFYLSTIYKVHKIEEIDLKLLNQHLFLSFLKFYEFWLTYNRSEENERKQNKKYYDSFDRNNFLENTIEEEKELDDLKIRTHKFQIKNLDEEEKNADEIGHKNLLKNTDKMDDDPLEKLERYLKSDGYNSQPEKSEIFDSKIKVNAPQIDIKKLFNRSLKEMFFRDITENYCEKNEQKIFYQYFFDKDTLEEIGKELNISAPAVHKKINDTLKKLAKIQELEDILSER